MSIKQEKLTEPRVVAIRSWVQCDGCKAVMSEQLVKTGFFDPSEEYTPHIDLLSGWIEVVKGSYGQRTLAHACARCADRSVGALLGI